MWLLLVEVFAGSFMENLWPTVDASKMKNSTELGRSLQGLKFKISADTVVYSLKPQYKALTVSTLFRKPAYHAPKISQNLWTSYLRLKVIKPKYIFQKFRSTPLTAAKVASVQFSGHADFRASPKFQTSKYTITWNLLWVITWTRICTKHEDSEFNDIFSNISRWCGQNYLGILQL